MSGSIKLTNFGIKMEIWGFQLIQRPSGEASLPVLPSLLGSECQIRSRCLDCTRKVALLSPGPPSVTNTLLNPTQWLLTLQCVASVVYCAQSTEPPLTQLSGSSFKDENKADCVRRDRGPPKVRGGPAGPGAGRGPGEGSNRDRRKEADRSAN